MAKQKVSQLDLIRNLLENRFMDDSRVLIEKNKDKKGNEFEMKREIVSHNDINFLLFRYDSDKVQLFPYFSEMSGLKKMCDYMMFVEENQCLHICLIELKLGTASATNQLIASESFAKFLVDSAKRVGLAITENIYIRKIRISEGRSKKQTTKKQALLLDENGIINYDYSTALRIKEILYIIEK